jgi:glycine cleavage system transcriptional repressor
MNTENQIKNIVISVLGTDRPGIVASVSKALFDNGCDVRDVSQTILQNEFAGIFVVSMRGETDFERLQQSLRQSLGVQGLAVFLKPITQGAQEEVLPKGEPFVVTTMGPDRMGLVAGITEVMAGFGVNIMNLKAIFRGGNDPTNNIMIYEVNVPVGLDQRTFREALARRARELELDLSMQHRDIFEEINRL